MKAEMRRITEQLLNFLLNPDAWLGMFISFLLFIITVVITAFISIGIPMLMVYLIVHFLDDLVIKRKKEVKNVNNRLNKQKNKWKCHSERHQKIRFDSSINRAR